MEFEGKNIEGEIPEKEKQEKEKFDEAGFLTNFRELSEEAVDRVLQAKIREMREKGDGPKHMAEDAVCEEFWKAWKNGEEPGIDLPTESFFNEDTEEEKEEE